MLDFFPLQINPAMLVILFFPNNGMLESKELGTSSICFSLYRQDDTPKPEQNGTQLDTGGQAGKRKSEFARD